MKSRLLAALAVSSQTLALAFLPLPGQAATPPAATAGGGGEPARRADSSALPQRSADPLHNTVMFDRSRFASVTDCLNAAARVHAPLDACRR